VTKSDDARSIERVKVPALESVVERNQVWSRVAAKYGVQNPVPPWKSSLDGICDALDQSGCGPEILSFIDRRNEEDNLSATIYSKLPYPENQLVSLAHSLVARGVIDEKDLSERMARVRARLEA
jgi:Nitrile hydratase beta subunit, N-terminal